LSLRINQKIENYEAVSKIEPWRLVWSLLAVVGARR